MSTTVWFTIGYTKRKKKKVDKAKAPEKEAEHPALHLTPIFGREDYDPYIDGLTTDRLKKVFDDNQSCINALSFLIKNSPEWHDTPWGDGQIENSLTFCDSAIKE